METIINDLKQQIQALENAYENYKRDCYEKQEHKNFCKGDWVTNGKDVGVVEWTENLSINCPQRAGYMGVDVKNGDLGFAVVRRDDWWLYEGGFYTKMHVLSIAITGEEICRLRYHLGPKNCNPSKVKTKVIDYLENLQREHGKGEGDGTVSGKKQG